MNFCPIIAIEKYHVFASCPRQSCISRYGYSSILFMSYNNYIVSQILIFNYKRLLKAY